MYNSYMQIYKQMKKIHYGDQTSKQKKPRKETTPRMMFNK